MCIAFDEIAPRQCNRQSRYLAEAVFAVDGKGDHHAIRDLIGYSDFWLKARWRMADSIGRS
jgi:hypothetical protein